MRYLTGILTLSLAAVTVVNAGELHVRDNDDKMDHISGKYIVVMNDDVSDSDFGAHRG